MFPLETSSERAWILGTGLCRRIGSWYLTISIITGFFCCTCWILANEGADNAPKQFSGYNAAGFSFKCEFSYSMICPTDGIELALALINGAYNTHHSVGVTALELYAWISFYWISRVFVCGWLHEKTVRTPHKREAYLPDDSRLHVSQLKATLTRSHCTFEIDSIFSWCVQRTFDLTGRVHADFS